MNKKFLIMLFTILTILPFSLAGSEDFENLDANCFSNSESIDALGSNTSRDLLLIRDGCNNGNEIRYETINLTLGVIADYEVIFGDSFIFVDSTFRPDMDHPAELTFRNQPFAVQPNILKDEESCDSDCTINSYRKGTLKVNVSGFSNYSLQSRQDFNTYSDEEPELQGKVYQVLDLGPSYRDEEFKCQVMIFADNDQSELVLVQTNPERKVQAKILGNPDNNQPESLGYFPTENGVANVYFRNDLLVGYTDFQYVAQCQSNTTQLIYEETITPVHSPLGRNFASRAVWLTTDNDGKNSFFLVFYAIAIILIVGLLMVWLRSIGVVRR